MPQAVISLASLAGGTFFPQKTAPSPYELLTCSARCPVVTPYHQIASDIEKLLTDNHSHSWTCSDTGQAIHMYSAYPKLSLHAGQLTSYGFVEQRLQAQADYYRNIYINVSACSVPACDVGHLRHIRDTLYSNYHLSRFVEQFVDVGKRLHFRSPRIILRTVHTGVIECSSEALTGFAAGVTTHLSSSHASAEFAKRVLRDAGFQGEIIYSSSP